MRRLASALAVVALAGALACSRIESAESGGGAALMRSLLRARTVEIVAPSVPMEDACRRAAQRIARERRVECRVLLPGQPGDPRAVRILVAGPDSELGFAIVRRMGLAPAAPQEPPSFRWRATNFAGPFDALLAVVEDPERPGLPLTLLYGNVESELAPFLGSLEPGWKPSLRIYRNFEPKLEAPLSVTGTIDESRLVFRAQERLEAIRDYAKSSARGDGIVLEASPRLEPEAIDRYLEAVARARSRTQAWAGVVRPASPVRLFLHDRPEALAACVGGATLSDWNPRTHEVHALLAPNVPDDAGRAAAGALAEDLLGPPSEAWLVEGAATFASGSHFGRDLEEWTAWLRSGGLTPDAGALVDPQATEAMSPHLVVPLRAALFRFLLEGRGEGFVRSLWVGQTNLFIDPELERSFDRWLDEVTSPREPGIAARHEERRGALLRGPFFAAVGIEEPGPEPDRGFGSLRFQESLSQAQDLGADGAAFTCYAVAEHDPIGLPDAAPGARAPLALAPTCGDLRLFAALCQTRGRGMRTLLQPRLLTAPGGSLAGTGPQDGETGWQRFFDGYARSLAHFELLAELAGADGISLGGGMTASTSASPGGWRAPPEEIRWRQDGWHKVVREARAAFSGSLTWAADSLIDARGLSFWDDLDLIASDLEADFDVPGTSFAANPVMQMQMQIDGEIAALEALARAHGRPLLLTQAGFRSGTPEPGAERSGRIVGSDLLQAMQLEVLGRSIEQARERAILRGAVLWRWSSDPSDEGANPSDDLLRPGPAREAAARILR